jgi:4'-phosphopantetheinyl transferase
MKYLLKSINDFSDFEIIEFTKKIKKAKYEKIIKKNMELFKESIVGEMLLCELLQKENIDYDNVQIKYNENGKPFITNYSIHYNISHDNGMVICAINELPIGVDIIKIKKRNINVAKMFCNDNELNCIKNLEDFHKVFANKEAYLKLRGLKINNVNNIEIDDKCEFECFVEDEYIISICYDKKI